MKLTDLDPVWIEQKYGKYGRIVGIRFKCPKCKGTQIAVQFLNPPDGGQPQPPDEKVCGNNDGKRWARSGLTFDDITLSPSVDASIVKRENYKTDEGFEAARRSCTEGGSSHWHGFLQHGQVT
jgi:hypothetical protein